MNLRLALGLAGIVFSGSALAQEPAEIARDYFHAYTVMDVDRMNALLADDAVFSDRGSFEVQGGPYHYEGRTAIIAALTSFHEQYGLYALSYDLEIDHEASGQAVFGGEVEARWRMPDGRDRVWRGDVVTTVRVRDGQVIEHLDMPDYLGGEMSIEEVTGTAPASR